MRPPTVSLDLCSGSSAALRHTCRDGSPSSRPIPSVLKRPGHCRRSRNHARPPRHTGMNDTRRVAILSAIVAVGLVSACGPQRVRTPERPGQTLTVLLPDSDSNTVGRATVSNASGTANLETARDSTLVSASEPPAPVTVLSESEIRRIFQDALSALPLPPQRFTLYFRFESNELTDESRAMLPEIRKAITGRPVPDLVVVGHTDTTGTRAANFELGRDARLDGPRSARRGRAGRGRHRRRVARGIGAAGPDS